MEKPPHVSKDLIDYLERTFPDRLETDPSVPDKELWMRAGGVRVIRKLRHLFDAQVERSLNSK
jgi:hypothetical protein